MLSFKTTATKTIAYDKTQKDNETIKLVGLLFLLNILSLFVDPFHFFQDQHNYY